MLNHAPRHLLLWLSWLLLLTACANLPGGNTAVTTAVPPPPRPPVTLQPTFTPLVTAGPLPSLTPPPARPTAVPNTPIPFGDTVVELRYEIPALGLERRLQGNIASEIIAVDETSGLSRQRSNQAGIMLELRAALPQMQLDPLPPDCAACVYVAYDLPGQGLADEGWLQDPVLLASIENYLTAALGPHFPPETVIGLRRAATAYAPAHSIALTGDGRLYTWLATEAQVSPPTAADPNRPELALLAELPLAELDDQYAADCLGSPLERLQLQQGDTLWQGMLLCPELALPYDMLPLYQRLADHLAQKTAVVSLPRPEPPFPLAALLDYRRPDGNRLTLLADGALVGQDAAGNIVTGTLTVTQPISLTNSLVRTNLLQPGLKTFAEDPTIITPRTILVVRGPAGLLDGQWITLPDNELFALLNSLLDDLLGADTAVTTPTETPLPAVTPTP